MKGSGLNRRAVLGLGAIASLGVFGGAAAWQYWPRASEQALSPPEAQALLERGALLLIDIRRPDEWESTGIAPGAVPIDMRREDFPAALRTVMAKYPGRPVAFICARGVRSRRLVARMAELGLPEVIDIPEGMLGSFSGPGWIKRGLPITMI